jgi:hypothetical protein
MRTKKVQARLNQLSAEPTHEKLPWPGLRANDRLSRVVTRAVKEAKEARARNEWAEKQIARVLDNVPPRVAVTLVFREMRRRGKPITRFPKALLKLLPD